MNERGGYPERIVPDETPQGIVALHLKRYDFSMAYIAGKRVLDVACGVGYGSAHLANFANEVVGVDLDEEAIAYARRRYGGPPNLLFVRGDAMKLKFVDASFDVVCSFETIEHIADVEAYLREVRRVLVPGGRYLASTPAARHSTDHPENPHHVREWSPADFERLLRRHFSAVELFSQVRRQTRLAILIKKLDLFKLRARLVPSGVTRRIAHGAGIRMMGDLQMDDVLIRPGVLRGASEIIAVCTV
ncbi:MAG TPA: class I SAM-dependent methyltransferase [Chloroflexia bacterium]|nr:class I SAM-dependent methyltransferase [Chloroflexia bacterium]